MMAPVLSLVGRAVSANCLIRRPRAALRWAYFLCILRDRQFTVRKFVCG